MKIILGIIFLTFMQPAIAAVTGNELYEQLKSQNQIDNQNAYAYLDGVIDTEGMYHMGDGFIWMMDVSKDKNAKFKSAHFCFGDNKITKKQVADVVQKYLEANPQNRHEPANGLIRRALIEAFPCAKNP